MNALMKFRLMVLRVADTLKFLPPILARLTIGIVFMGAGWMKITNLSKAVGFFTDLGIPSPSLMAPFVAFTEMFCGFLVFAGCFTRVASVPLTMVMTVAILTAKRGQLGALGDLFGLTDFLYMVLLANLFVDGAGRFSVDAWLHKQFGGRGNDGMRRDVAKAA
jgi:putative oxidoreductase